MKKEKKEELKKLKEILNNFNEEHDINTKALQEMEQTQIVKEYLELKHNQEELDKSIKKLQCDVKIASMLACDHIFRPISARGERNDRTTSLYCIRCGLTNQFEGIYRIWKDSPDYQERINYALSKTSPNEIKLDLDFSTDQISYYKLYNKVVASNPDLTKEEIIQKMIEFYEEEKRNKIRKRS